MENDMEFEFDRDCDRHLPLTEPAKTKAGEILAPQPTIIPQPQLWWRAQCALRGLSIKGTTFDLQTRIRNRDASKDEEYARISGGISTGAVEEQPGKIGGDSASSKRPAAERKSFDSQHRSKRPGRPWGRPSRSARKSAPSVPFPGYALPMSKDEGSTDDEDEYENHEAEMGYHFGDGRDEDGGKEGNHDDATNDDKVKVNEAENTPIDDVFPLQLGNSMQTAREIASNLPVSGSGAQRSGRPRLTARKSVRPRPYPKPERIIKAVKQVEWDITGDWEIECEKLVGFYGELHDNKLTMDISHDTSKPGNYMATFNFNVIQGIMRIVCPEPKDDDSEIRGTYIYRGREGSEGVIQIGSDQKIYHISFSQKGCSLKGTFGGGAVGRVSFVGLKVGSQREASSASAWEAYSEEAYESEGGDR